ncbi:bis-aminopropyl spermidine synthase family protein [Clostridium oryzae]|uniref:N(4)-bis(aminopropyl)spermidine synthase C-terminal domain-containing protein n=1 Tax=Clostridium oryzae TaxID=1450648 RepID=A0A1V4IT30_9CLOT|nr:bis-aminopropyl spermidine synthase family protein [Clostridium oryzae]OPJ63086.1 hypothetical protein CLORY_14520 [Clostridium oryzae]
MNEIINRVVSNVKLEEGKQVIQNQLIDIYFNDGISTKKLARKNMLPIPVVSAVKKEFVKAGLAVQNIGMHITGKGKLVVEKELGYEGIDKYLYMKLMENPWGEHKELYDIKEQLSRIFINRPEADVSIDQSKCTVDTAIKRAILCLKYSSLIGKQVLCVGDDDFISVAIGFLLKRLFNGKIPEKSNTLVMDVDERILSYIRGVANENGLPISCVYSDFRQPILEYYKGNFDCFFTDPPYTLEGMKLFLSRGMDALKKEKGLTVFFSYGHKSPDIELEIQKCFINMGLTVCEILSGFNAYEGAQIIGNTSQMIVLKTTTNSHASVVGSFDKPMYTGEIRKTVRLYSCTQCGKVFKVGKSERYYTIESLKAAGCSKCENRSFRLFNKNKI